MVDACGRCSRFGKILWKLDEIKPEIKNRKIDGEDSESIIENYDKIIRKERERRGLKLDGLARKLNEKESLIQKIENGEMMPSLKLAKKMEKFFGAKLVENVFNNKIEIKRSETKEFTIGDVIKQKGTG